MKNLFAYGTLMCEDIMHEVSGCRMPHFPGMLVGFCRRCIKGENYPAVIPDESGMVEGLVYRNVPDRVWKRLDCFEGEMYARRSVEVELTGDGTTLPAETYVLQTAFSNRLSQFDWSFDDFLVYGKKEFRQRFRGYRVI